MSERFLFGHKKRGVKQTFLFIEIRQTLQKHCKIFTKTSCCWKHPTFKNNAVFGMIVVS